jgi:aryl-alcohol dehydrogenase-like predicted oxidoreductase
MKRRDFLGLTTLATGAAVLNPVVGSAQTTLPPNAGEPVEPVWVPLTKEIKSTRIGFGTGMRGGQRRSDLVRGGYPKAIELLRFAYDQGIRLFDCADMYGTHDVVAEALRDKPRDSYVLVSKIWLRTNGGLPEIERPDPEISVKRFLREVKTDYIDVVQIHCITDTLWTEQYAEAMRSMEKLKKAGLIRAHGISSHSNAATELAAETEWCDVIHVRINSEGLAMDGPRDDAAARVAESARAAKKAHEAGKGILAMKIIGQGEGTMVADAELRKKSTKFVMNLGCINVMIVGFTEKEHISEFVTNVAALSADG